VAAVPYDVVNTSEARALALGNPLSFLHVSRAEIDLPPARTRTPTSCTSARRATSRPEGGGAARRRGDARPLRLPARDGSHVQTGVAGCFSLREYDDHVIKKHEHTRPDKEDDRTKHLIRLGAQTGPVFLTYRSEVAISDLIAGVTEERPLFSFTAADGVQHAVWRVADALVPAIVAGLPPCRRSISPTATIVRPAPPGAAPPGSKPRAR
jgi:uncharacterized protein (DUF1015 family)